MKTIICGPPHSGKSVFVSSLVKLMPSDSYIRINANGDGEGTWSNNPDQSETMTVRRKVPNSYENFVLWSNQIKTANRDIVLIDIGGIIDENKGLLFDQADSFIIISSDENMVTAWKEFGESHNCVCLAIVDSQLNGQDSVVSKEPILHARLNNLERGKDFCESDVIKTIANLVVTSSGYKRTELVNFQIIGERIGDAIIWETDEGIEVSHIHFNVSNAQKLYDELSKLYHPNTKYRFFNLFTNWVAVIAADVLCGGNVSMLSFYDGWSDTFISPAVLRKSNMPDANLKCEIRETDIATFLSFTVGNNIIDNIEFRNYSLPLIDESKPLFISGKFPTWFIVSVSGSYNTKEQYVFQPGNHYICVKSHDVRNLGKIVKEY